jgi:hypothetical protein
MRAQLGDLHGRTGIALFLLAQLKELLGVTDSKVRPCGPSLEPPERLGENLRQAVAVSCMHGMGKC